MNTTLYDLVPSAPSQPRARGYVAGTPSRESRCLICGREERLPGAVVFVEGDKRICHTCVAQITDLVQSHVVQAFWD